MKTAMLWLTCVLTTVAACGSDDVAIGENKTADGGPSASTGTNGASGSMTPMPGSPATSSPGTVSDAGPDADAGCTPTDWYKDADGDGVGGADKQSACSSPGAGWVATGGDCDDANASVYPGQAAWFGVPYANGTSRSFDYDCSKVEEEKPGQLKATQCLVGIGGCSGAGFLPAASNAGAPPAASYCGSSSYRTCRLTNGQCVPIDGKTDAVFACH